VIVRDRGSGSPPEDLEQVFDRFYGSAAARNRPGTGLGLAIVRQVAETHGGSVEAHNAPEGGAVMSLRLPVRPMAAAAASAQLAHGGTSGSRSILGCSNETQGGPRYESETE
jgi:K+-sensing histidine kinase KdpD